MVDRKKTQTVNTSVTFTWKSAKLFYILTRENRIRLKLCSWGRKEKLFSLKLPRINSNTAWGNRHLKVRAMQFCYPGLQGWWLLPSALCLLLLQPVDLRICRSSFHPVFRPHLRLLGLVRSWPLPWPAAAVGLWQGPGSPRPNHPLEDRSALPLLENLQLYLGTGGDPMKR